MVALNCPDDGFYERNRAMYDWHGDGWQSFRFAGRGVATFFEDLLDYVRFEGLRVVRLHDIYREAEAQLDRKSTRLNSSHANISYAVFCLKKKKKMSQN